MQFWQEIGCPQLVWEKNLRTFCMPTYAHYYIKIDQSVTAHQF